LLRCPGRPIAWRRIGTGIQVLDNALWTRLVNRYVKPRAEEPKAAAAAIAADSHLQKVFDPEDIVRAVNQAVREALLRHKERGESIVIWRDGKIVTLKPEEIDV